MIPVSKTTIHTDDTSKGATIIIMKRVSSWITMFSKNAFVDKEPN